MFESAIVVTQDIAQHVGAFFYVVIGAVAMIETALGVGLFFPGSVLVLLAGVAATSGELSLTLIILGVAIGAVLGDYINYWLGRRYGKSLVGKHRFLLTQKQYDNVRVFYDRHGAKAVFIGRFVAVVKEVVPFIAGMTRMDAKTFFIYNAFGAMGWSVLWAGSGYLFVYMADSVHTLLVRFELMSLVAVIIFCSLYFYRKNS